MRPPVGWHGCQPTAFCHDENCMDHGAFPARVHVFFRRGAFFGEGSGRRGSPRKVFSLSPQSIPPHLTPNKFEMHFYDDLKCDV